MGPVKFRIWDTVHNEMHEWKDFRIKTQFGNEGMSFITKYNNEKSDRMQMLQFIGLQDKEENDIYEGDILKFDYGGVEYVGHVAFEQAMFIIVCEDLMDNYIDFSLLFIEEGCCTEVEVIGNKFENPELLKK